MRFGRRQKEKRTRTAGIFVERQAQKRGQGLAQDVITLRGRNRGHAEERANLNGRREGRAQRQSFDLIKLC